MQTRTDLARNTERFHEWERIGRGTIIYPHLVPLEPPFRPFTGYWSFADTIQDDGRRPTVFSRFWDTVAGKAPPALPPASYEEAEIVAADVPDGVMEEMEILVPPDHKLDPQLTQSFLQAIAGAAEPVAFELIGSDNQVSMRISCFPRDARLIRAQLGAFFPFSATDPTDQTLVRLWRRAEAEVVAGVEFGLAREFMVPIRESSKGSEFLTALIGALSQAAEGELAVFQVLFTPARNPWAPNALRAVTSPDGEPFFVDAPEVTKLAQEKLSSPLYAVGMRALVNVHDEESADDILRGVVSALGTRDPTRNAFLPLDPEDGEDFQYNVLLRCTNRSGMILSLPELSSIVRVPGADVRTPALVRTRQTSQLPDEVLGEQGVVIGEGDHDGLRVPVRLPLEARLSHTYVIGASGTGKSMLLEQMILQDIESGRGVAVLDPHGDLVDELLARIPEHRVQDVVLFDPSDPEWVVGWNILGAHSEVEKEMLASDLVAVWKRLSTSWGDQMTAVLGNAVLAFLESSVGGTLADLRKFLLDDKFRAAFLGTVKDEHVRSYWREEFPLLVGRKPQAPILTRLDTLLRSRLVRESVIEREKPLNFRDIMDGKKIFLAKLAQGAIGEENAALLGSLLVSKFHQTALSRQEMSQEAREPFMLFIDEFQLMATPSMASLFSGVRKYKLALCVAHQDLYQLHNTAPELERSILSSAYTRIVFRISEEDARRIERGMGEFGENDLVNLARGEAICRVGRGANAFRLRTAALDPIPSTTATGRRERIRAESLAQYGRRRTPATDAVPPKHASAAARDSIPGRGGREHKYLQELIKRAAEERGFKVQLEKRVLDGHGHVDAALSLGAISVACEISVTTGAAHEVDNVVKCLAAGFTHVAVVSSDGRWLAELRTRADVDGVARGGNVYFMSPTEFIALLDEVRVEARRSAAVDAPPQPDRRSAARHGQAPARPPEIPADPNALLDVEQASAYVRRAPQTLAKLRCIGGGPPFLKIGRNVFYAKSDLDAWLDSRRRRSTSEPLMAKSSNGSS